MNRCLIKKRKTQADIDSKRQLGESGERNLKSEALGFVSESAVGVRVR